MTMEPQGIVPCVVHIGKLFEMACQNDSKQMQKIPAEAAGRVFI
jgi:hypothetical protein